MTSETINISFFADHPEYLESLAPHISEHWRPIIGHEKIESRVKKLRLHMSYNTLPIAWVADTGSQVLGTAALRVCDLPGYEHLTPWLGGVYVLPQFRRRGIGTKLCLTVEQYAKHIEGIEKLYLFTLDQKKWYESLGWSTFAPCSWHGHAGEIMYKNLNT